MLNSISLSCVQHFLQIPFFEKEGLTVGQVAGGQHHSLVCTADGTAIYAWGRGDSGQLGANTKFTEKGSGALTPQRVHSPEGLLWKQIGAGEFYSMALTYDGELYTWGFEGVTGHGGKYMDMDCVFPRLLDLDGMVVHAISGGAQHGVLLAGPKPKPPSPKQPQTKRRKVN